MFTKSDLRKMAVGYGLGQKQSHIFANNFVGRNKDKFTKGKKFGEWEENGHDLKTMVEKCLSTNRSRSLRGVDKIKPENDIILSISMIDRSVLKALQGYAKRKDTTIQNVIVGIVNNYVNNIIEATVSNMEL